MNNADVIICQNFQQDLTEAVSQHAHDQVYILTDETTHKLCLPLLNDLVGRKYPITLVYFVISSEPHFGHGKYCFPQFGQN